MLGLDPDSSRQRYAQHKALLYITLKVFFYNKYRNFGNGIKMEVVGTVKTLENFSQETYCSWILLTFREFHLV